MKEQENVKLVKQAYSAFSRHDMQSFLGLFAKEVSVQGPTLQEDILPWGGRFKGLEGATRFFKTLGEYMEIEVLEPRDYVAQGDTVVVLGYIKGRMRSTHNPYEIEFVHIFTIQDHKFIRFLAYNDTATLVNALSHGPEE